MKKSKNDVCYVSSDEECLALGLLPSETPKYIHTCKTCKRKYGSFLSKSKEKQMFMERERPDLAGSCPDCNMKLLRDEFIKQKEGKE